MEPLLKYGLDWHDGRDGGWKWLMQGSLLYDNVTGCVAGSESIILFIRSL